MLGEHERMDLEVMTRIQRWGVSRIPIYRGARSNVVGLLLVKEHIALDPDDKVPIAQLSLRMPAIVHPDMSIFDVLNVFQTGHSHMAIVTEAAEAVKACLREGAAVPAGTPIAGVCTIEDVIEEMIGEEVLDETDEAVTEAERVLAVARFSVSDVHSPMPRTSVAGVSEAERAAAWGAADPLLGEVEASAGSPGAHVVDTSYFGGARGGGNV